MRIIGQSRSSWMAVIFIAALGESALASRYQLEVIAEEGTVIDGREILGFSIDPNLVAINNDREVAFFAGVSWQGQADWALMTQRRFIAGAGKRVDGRVPYFNDEDHGVDINNHGQVTYTAFLPEGGRGLFVNETLLVAAGDQIDGRTLTRLGREPVINDAGTVVFDSWYAGHAGDALFTQDKFLLEVGDALGGYTLGSLIFPQINNSGDIVVMADLLELETFFKKAVVSLDDVVLKPGDQVEGIAIHEVRMIGGVIDTGDVVISGIAKSIDSTLTSVIVTQDSVLFAPRGDVFDLAASRVIFNNRRQLAVLGAVALTEGGFRRVLFVDDKIILSEGDILEGKLVKRIYQNFDMNDRGDVAFRVEFEGRERPRGIVLATVPEPAGLTAFVGAGMALLVARRCGDRRDGAK